MLVLDDIIVLLCVLVLTGGIAWFLGLAFVTSTFLHFCCGHCQSCSGDCLGFPLISFHLAKKEISNKFQNTFLGSITCYFNSTFLFQKLADNKKVAFLADRLTRILSWSLNSFWGERGYGRAGCHMPDMGCRSAELFLVKVYYLTLEKKFTPASLTQQQNPNNSSS